MYLRSFIATIFIACVICAAHGQVIAQPPAPHSSATASTKYLNTQGGKSADELVELALANNGEVLAMRRETEAGEALIRQARLRPNPSVSLSGTRQIGGMGDNSLMVEGAMPLELGGRRGARIRVAERELAIRQQALAERERQLAAEVRAKFGESVAAILKLAFAEEVLSLAIRNFELVSARVTEGRRPPLEESMEVVELNRIRALREINEGTVEVSLFELRNLVGLDPTEPLVLNGDLETLRTSLPTQLIAEVQALRTRTDLLGAIAVEQLAAARLDQARSEGKVDADAMIGYQRMRSGFPLLGIEEGTGALLPIEQRMNFFTFGVRLNLPLWNRNQGMVAAAELEVEAARDRREFGELTIKREVAAAYARYNRAFRAMEIYRVGVRDRAAENLDVVRQTYELGSKTLLDYISEHHRFIEIENGYIDARLAAYLALVEILKVTNDPSLK